METFGMDKTSWDAVKTSFLRSLDQKYSAKTVCANLQDFMQRPREAVFPYFAQNVGTFQRLMAAKPNKMPQAT